LTRTDLIVFDSRPRAIAAPDAHRNRADAMPRSSPVSGDALPGEPE
jgi:hypothetical protein